MVLMKKMGVWSRGPLKFGEFWTPSWCFYCMARFLNQEKACLRCKDCGFIYILNVTVMRGKYRGGERQFGFDLWEDAFGSFRGCEKAFLVTFLQVGKDTVFRRP